MAAAVVLWVTDHQLTPWIGWIRRGKMQVPRTAHESGIMCYVCLMVGILYLLPISDPFRETIGSGGAHRTDWNSRRVFLRGRLNDLFTRCHGNAAKAFHIYIEPARYARNLITMSIFDALDQFIFDTTNITFRAALFNLTRCSSERTSLSNIIFKYILFYTLITITHFLNQFFFKYFLSL